MEQIPSRESSQQHIDALLMRAQTHALPVDVVENITKEIEALKVSSDDSAIEKILQLQKTLEESTITVQTLSDFKLLLERVALNNIHFDASLVPSPSQSSCSSPPAAKTKRSRQPRKSLARLRLEPQ